MIVPFFYLRFRPFLHLPCHDSHRLLCIIFDPHFPFSFRDKFQNQISEQQQRQPQTTPSNNNQNRRNVEVKKKVWSVDPPDSPQPQSPTAYPTNGNGHHSSTQQQTNGLDVSQNSSRSI